MSFHIPNRMEVSVELPTDNKGLTARECPNCKRIFKVKNGTGLKGKDLPCHCAYCGHVKRHDEFHTKEQVKYAKSVVMRKFTDSLHTQMKKVKSLKVEVKSPYPIRYYYEKALETDVVCDQCTLVYAIYGEFAFCPDCGSHNSVTILKKNIEFVGKMLSLAEAQEQAMAARLVGDALENLVSTFDGFGREVCSVASPKAVKPAEAKDLRFQNLAGTQKRLQQQFGFDLAAFLSPDDWKFICRCFEKRHLLAHKMGVVDEDYLLATNDYSAAVGRKVVIVATEVNKFGTLLLQLGERLSKQLLG
ncbi:MAG: hypothetical protein U1F83_05715 [Verrucomicrobiota bacterium]